MGRGTLRNPSNYSRNGLVTGLPPKLVPPEYITGFGIIRRSQPPDSDIWDRSSTGLFVDVIEI